MLLLFIPVSQAENIDFINPKNTAEIIRQANIHYDSLSFRSGIAHVPLMVSNGIVGGCFDHMGFQSRPNTGYPQGRTVFGYIRNYDRHASSRQIQFPLAVIQAEFADASSVLNLMEAREYSQVLDLYTGILTTSYDLFGDTQITAFAHQTIPNLFVMQIDRVPDLADKRLILKIVCETSLFQNNDFGWPVDPIQTEFQISENRIRIKSSTDMRTTNWVIQADAEFSVSGHTVSIALQPGKNVVKYFINRPDCPNERILNQSFEQLLTSHTREWSSLWNTCWIDFPSDREQKIWMRSLYYALSHFPVIPEKPAIPTGLNSNIWGFTFPQDVYYVAENLPRLGHDDRFLKALQYWLDVLPQVKDYTQRIIGVNGAFYPWTPPFEDWSSYEKDGVVSPDSYELHNPVYVAAMVWHYYQRTADETALKKYFPIIEEVLRYYANISFKNDHGTFDIYHKYTRGQDEASSTEGGIRNFLCASYSAEYSARIYVKAAEIVQFFDRNLYDRAQTLINYGYECEALMSEHGWYRTYQGDNRPPGSQKHPVQLNPIAFLPMPNLVTPDSPVMTAWEHRYELTKQAKKPLTLGWTFGEFALASCRLGQPQALRHDLGAIQPCHGADPRWIQFYESSFWPGWHMNKSYYLPMTGLYLQTFTDALVQDWRGEVDLFACILPEWEEKELTFYGIRTLKGITVSGIRNKDGFKVQLDPGQAQNVILKIHHHGDGIKAGGQKQGPAVFSGHESVPFVFEHGTPIHLEYREE